MSEDTEGISIRFPRPVMEALDAVCGGKSAGGRGKRSGRAHWVEGLVYRELGMTPPEMAPRMEDSLNLQGLDLAKLDKKTRMAVEAYQTGIPVPQIVGLFLEARVPTPSGKPWTTRLVRRVLATAEKRAKRAREKKQKKEQTPK